jgi:hypothetical protein
MYGPGDQSFHGAYRRNTSNPMTLRLREVTGPMAAEARTAVDGLGAFVNRLDAGITSQTVAGVTPILRTRVLQGQADHRRLRRDLKKATNRGQYLRINAECMQVKSRLRDDFRSDLMDGYETLTGTHLANWPADLQGLNTLVTNYLAAHPGTGIFGGVYAYATGWRQKLLDFQTLLGSFDPRVYL